MRAGADIGTVARDRRIMKEAQHAIAVAHRVLEIIRGEAEMAGDRLEDAEPGAVERGEQFEEGVAERLDLIRPDVRRHIFAIGMAGGQLAADMPELLEVVGGRALRGLDPERRVAARAAAAGNVMAALYL